MVFSFVFLITVCVCNNSRWNLLNDLDQVVGRLAASQHADFAVY